MRMTDDEIRQEYAILERSRQDPKAFGELYEKYFERIFNFIYRQTDDEALTADLTSQSFLNALKNVARFELRGVPVTAWRYGIASNEENKHHRRITRERVFSSEEPRMRALIEGSGELFDEESVDKLLEYLKDLSTEILEVLELRFFEAKDFKAIAF